MEQLLLVTLYYWCAIDSLDFMDDYSLLLWRGGLEVDFKDDY